MTQLICHSGGEWGGPRHGVLDGVWCIRWGSTCPRGRTGFGFFLPTDLNGVFECIFKTETYLTHAWKVDNIPVWTICQWNRYLLFFLEIYFVTRSKLAFTRHLL